MAETPTFNELRDIGRAAALLRSSKLTEASFASGFMFDILLGLDAAIAEEVIRYALELHARTFFGTASGEHLDALADDHFSLARRLGSAAIGKARFQRPSAAPGPVLIEVGTTVETPEGVRFKTIDPAVITGLSISVDIICDQVGPEGNVAAGKITVLVDAPADASITVTNPEPTAGGIGIEVDSAFRQRVREYLRTLRRGTVDALAFGAQIEGVVQATVDDTVYPPVVYIADYAGAANTALVDAVKAELVNWRSAGIAVNVVGATVVQQPIELAVTYQTGVDTSEARSRIIAAILDEIAKIGIGGTLYRAALIAAARVRGVVNVVVNEPAGDVQPAKNELIRTSVELIEVA